MNNLHNLRTYRLLDTINRQLRQATSVAQSPVVALGRDPWTPSERAWFRSPIGGAL